MIYLDYHATTPCDPQVIQAMLPYFGEVYANPSSTVHEAGREAADAIDEARSKVANLIGAKRGEVIFTGGATESNNLAILGIARASRSARRRIVTTAIEHKAVSGPCHKLSEEGFEIVILPVDSQGRIRRDEAQQALNENTLLVSVQAANNEIGTIQPVKEISRLVHERGALVHCDAAQAVGRIPVNVRDWDIDLLSISAHKLYGPKGAGAMYIKGGRYALPIDPICTGGGQEWELRPGTLNVPGIVGFGEACRLCQALMPEEAERRFRVPLAWQQQPHLSRYRGGYPDRSSPRHRAQHRVSLHFRSDGAIPCPPGRRPVSG